MVVSDIKRKILKHFQLPQLVPRWAVLTVGAFIFWAGEGGEACDGSYPPYPKACLCSAPISVADWLVPMGKLYHLVHACSHILQHNLDNPNVPVAAPFPTWVCCPLLACQLPRRDPLITNLSAPSCNISSRDQPPFTHLFLRLVGGGHSEGG